MKLIVGLGNPGSQYQETKHNVGFWVVDRLARRHQLRWSRDGRSEVADGRVGGERAVLAKPQTFMNHSGPAIAALLQSRDLEPPDLVVVYDDLDLDVGRIRIRGKGSSGGHRGMESVIRSLGADGFVRVRLGIGRAAGVDPVDYVLRPFSAADLPTVETAVERAAEAIEWIIGGRLDEAMNEFNRDL